MFVFEFELLFELEFVLEEWLELVLLLPWPPVGLSRRGGANDLFI